MCCVTSTPAPGLLYLAHQRLNRSKGVVGHEIPNGKAVLTHRAIPMGNVIVWAELQVVLSANCQHDEKEGELMGVEKCGAARRVLEVTGLDLDVSRVDLINNLI
jgi:hypothetical protein